MSQAKVSVIMPSYNRAHLLEEIIPSYIQKYVGEIIIIDDGSKDNTEEVVKKLNDMYGIIKYKKQEKNGGQVIANNTGIGMARYEYIYFGDDDSFIYENSIENALNCMEKYNADIVGIRALYMLPNETYRETIKRCSNNYGKFYNINKLKIDFSFDLDKEIRLPFVHACLLVKTKIAKEVKFDINYGGSAYREETDFILSCSEKGYDKVYYCPKAISINLPRVIATGGAWNQSWWRYEKSTILNNHYFLNKHYKYLKDHWELKTPKYLLNILFVCERITFRTKWFIKRMWK